MAVWLRRRNDDAKEEVRVILGELADIATLAAAEARSVAVNARRTLARRGVEATGNAKALVEDLERTAILIEAIVGQTRVRIAGGIPDGSTRIVSLHDPDARPIAKGRLGKPVEFGCKAQLADNVDGIIVDYKVFKGNPPDAPMLAPAIERIKQRFGRAPKKVTADRGYGEAGIDAKVEALGVKTVAIPRKGKPGVARQNVQRKRGFVKLVKWRTGSEARVACVKREWGWSRMLMDGEHGAATWAGWGIFGHNSNKISALVAKRTGPPGQDLARKRAG
jgi:IS5 family transposase